MFPPLHYPIAVTTILTLGCNNYTLKLGVRGLYEICDQIHESSFTSRNSDKLITINLFIPINIEKNGLIGKIPLDELTHCTNVNRND